MVEIRDSSALQDWLNGRAVKFACVLAARAALRVVPVLEIALHEDGEERRRDVILPTFRALASSCFAGAWPRRAGEVGKVARTAGQEASAAISGFADDARWREIEAQEAIPELDDEVWRLRNAAQALGVAERSVEVAVEATHSVVAIVAAEEGVGSPAAAREAAVSATQVAHSAIDDIHGDRDIFDEPQEGESEEGAAPHIEEFWNSVAQDVAWLESGENTEIQPEETVTDLSESAL